MSGTLQVCLYNVEPEASQELRDKINSLNYVRVIAEVGTPDGLAETLRSGGTNLVFFHLDPDPAKILEAIDHVSQRYPELAMIAASHDARPDAILAPIRAGCDQFVCEPIDDSELAAAVSRVASKRLLRDLVELASKWDIPLKADSSVWPSAAGLAPARTGVVCGLGPQAQNLQTPREAVSRIGLLQRTVLLALYLLSQR